jgi:hypothetical protein
VHEGIVGVIPSPATPQRGSSPRRGRQGLRSGELLGVAWGDGLDLEQEVVRVRQSVDRVRGEDGRFPIIAPKSRAAVRDVALDLPPSRSCAVTGWRAGGP